MHNVLFIYVFIKQYRSVIFVLHSLHTGMQFEGFRVNTGSTDMGNVSHVVPSFHPLYQIPCKGHNHTKEFADAAGLPTAQEPTLKAAKAMAMTAISVLRCPNVLKEAKEQFEIDLVKDE